MKLSTHFTLEEAVNSQTASRDGISNVPSQEVIAVMMHTAERMEVVRHYLNSEVSVDSWYRCLALNRALKSKDTSQHILGEAVDFIAPLFGSPLVICKQIISNRSDILFDQLILEHTWVHISFCSNPNVSPRGEVLSLLQTKKYARGLTDTLGNPL